MNNNLPNTFLSLIEEYKIEIPMIQRDYAQGRDDDKTHALRKNFIKDILSHIADNNTNKTLELDFIYGPITENKTLIPIDGQQRLTTLFLLHWYLAKQTETYINSLKNFTYKVRSSTQDFLNELLDENKGRRLIFNNSPKNEILDASWYYSIWNYDPSIQGMLNTLDTIHNEAAKYDNYNLWKNLNEHSCIEFNLLNMDKYNLSDELYLKMNARGLALSDFENFKAWLQGYCGGKIKDDEYFSTEEREKKWITRIDRQWTDFFWQLSCSGNSSFDRMFMNFFHGMTLFFAVENDEESKWKDKKLLEIEKVKLLREAVIENEYVPFEYYKNNNCFTQDNLIVIFKILDKSKELQINFSFKEDVFQEFVSPKTSYRNRVSFYALYKYLLKSNYNSNSPEKKMIHYKRVMSNLIENSTIDSPATFHSAIKSINKLSNKFDAKFDILTYLTGDEDIDFFNREQLKEEKLKAKLILSNIKGWEEAIISAENHEFFRGQINFLLNPFEELSLDKFKQRFNNACFLFDKNGAKKEYSEDALLLRAFISQCSSWGQLWKFKFDNTSKNWKAILAKEELKAPLNQLLEINTEQETLKSQLQIFCKNVSCFKDNMVEKLIHEDLYKSKLLTKVVSDCIMHSWASSSLSGLTYILYPYNAKASWKMYVIGTIRNTILALLLENKIITLKWKVKLDGIPYFHGRNIRFIYKDKEFDWSENDNITCNDKSYHLNEVKESLYGNDSEKAFTKFLEDKFIINGDKEIASNK